MKTTPTNETILPNLVIAVTGLNAIDSPGPGIAVIRAIRECPDFEVRIIGLNYEALEPGIYMHDLVDKTYQIPYPSVGTESLMHRLQEIHAKENLSMILPNFDAELFNFIKLQDDLERMGIRTFLPTMEQFESRHKHVLMQFGTKHNLLVPEDRKILQPADLVKAAEELDFPLVVKGKYYDATVVQTIEEAMRIFYQLQSKWGLPVIAQKFVRGTEINIAVLGDGKGNMISAIPMRKLYITDKGKAWAGITLEEKAFTDLASRFVASTKWRGGCELEIMHTQDGKSYIMEINPRFPAWIYLSAAAGHNQPAALVKLAMGLPLDSFGDYEAGKMFIRYSWDMITDVTDFQQISGTGEL